MADGDPLKNIERSRNTDQQLRFYDALNAFIEESDETPREKMHSFAAYTTRQAVTTFLERYEVYKLAKNVPGSILECGVGSGQGLMAFAHFCSIFEPYHYVRKVIGFDTFTGFTGITDKDRSSKARHLEEGGLCFDTYEKLTRSIELYDRNRALGHIPKVHLVKGDISQTLPAYLEEHPELMVGLLYMDLDLYQPTRDSLAALEDRLHKGSIVAFDELNHGDYPGETAAVIETLGLKNLRLERFDISSMMCYCRIGG